MDTFDYNLDWDPLTWSDMLGVPASSYFFDYRDVKGAWFVGTASANTLVFM